MPVDPMTPCHKSEQRWIVWKGILVVLPQTKPCTYFLINRGKICYLIFTWTSHVPDLLHHLNSLLDRHVPRVCGLSNEGDIHWDKGLPEPFLQYKWWKLLKLSFFGFLRLLDKFLDSNSVTMMTTKHMTQTRLMSLVTRFFPLGGLWIAANRSSPWVSSLSDTVGILWC